MKASVALFPALKKRRRRLVLFQYVGLSMLCPSRHLFSDFHMSTDLILAVFVLIDYLVYSFICLHTK